MCLIFHEIAIYLIRMKQIISVLIFILAVTVTVYSEKDAPSPDGASSPDNKPTIAVLPVFHSDVPVYVPKVVDKLIDAKIEKIGTYNIVSREDIQRFLDSKGIVLKKEPTIEDLRKYSDVIGVDQVLIGRISAEGEGFSLDTKLYDVKQRDIVLSDTETSKDLRGLDVSVNNIVRKVVHTTFPTEVAEEAKKVLDEEKDTKKEEQVKKNIEDFSNLVEKDPEKALDLFDEPARKALENTVKKKVVKDEIQNLFEKEKAEKEHKERLKKERKWLIFMESGIQLGNLLGLAAVNKRIDSVLYWDYYMNNTFPIDAYGEYNDYFGPYIGLQSFNYLLSGGLNLWLSRAYNRYLPDAVMLSPPGKTVFRISSVLQIAGYMALTSSSQLGFISQHYYINYMNADGDFTNKYDDYRTWHTVSKISNYMTMGMWGLGLTGITASLFLSGDKEPLILSDRSRRFLKWSQILVSAGNLTSGMATNYRGRAEESWINDHASADAVGESNYDLYHITSEVLYYTSYAVYAGSAVLAYMGLSDTGAGRKDGNSASEKENLSFSVLPAADGFTSVFWMRF